MALASNAGDVSSGRLDSRAAADKMVLAGRQAEPARHPVFIGVAFTEPGKVISQGVDVIVEVVLVVARPRRQSVESAAGD